MLEIGQAFEDKYVIRRLLGAGGFALVYQAHQASVGRDVAIKVLRPAKDIGTHPATLLARFEREAKMAAELRNEHNIHLFDFGRSADGVLYMIFEFVDGQPLDEFIRATGPLAAARVVPILIQLLSALSEAHRLGILHRDVKPQNVMLFERLGETDRAKLIDYGIAKPMGKAEAGNNITAEGHIVGTPRYMAPEQIMMLGELTPATDIYSLGLVAYEMLAGKSLLGDSTHTEVIKRQLSGEVFRVPPAVPAPPGLRRVIDTMLAKSVRDRFESAEAVIEALRAVDVNEPVERVPSVDEILVTLAGDSQESTAYDDAIKTVDSRPVAMHDGPENTAVDVAPATIDAPPTAHLDDLRTDSAIMAAGEAGATLVDVPKVRPLVLLVVVAVLGAAVISAGVAGFVLSRSDTAARVAKKVKRKVDGARGLVAAGCDDDIHEPNDRSTAGTLLEEGSLHGTLCPKNVDWYRLGYVQAGDVVTVGVEHEAGDHDIDMELFVDANFEGGVWTPKRAEVLSVQVKHAGVAAVRLYYPTVEPGEGRGYRVTRDLDSLPTFAEDAATSTDAGPADSDGVDPG